MDELIVGKKTGLLYCSGGQRRLKVDDIDIQINSLRDAYEIVEMLDKIEQSKEEIDEEIDEGLE